MSVKTLNDFLFLEPYQQGQGLKGNVKSGFAYIAQKTNLAPLKVMADVELANGTLIKAGSIAYIDEEILSNAEWAKKIKTADFTDGQEFIIVEAKYVKAIKE